MATQTNTPLSARRREVSGSRSVRRLRREGAVPGILYGGGEDPVPFAVDSRELRHALADAGAILDFQLEGESGTPVLLKEHVRHPVTGASTHIDLLRVNLDVAIQTTVTLELTGTEEAEGVRLSGGILEQPVREVTVEALPNEIPDVIQHDVSEMEIGDTLTLAAISVPAGVRLVDDPETLIATISAPRLQVEPETEIETETEVVGEGEEGAEAEAGADGESSAGDAESAGGESAAE